MSDEEEESMSEGFSASEDEWKPTKDVKGGESSDDDDSDFEDSRHNTGAQSVAVTGAARRKISVKGSLKQTAIKKRKSAGQSLRTKLYNKYRPPPKTFPSPNSAGSNSPSASTSRTASKNAKVPNESGEQGNDSSSESSVEDYLVNPADIDLQSSFFKIRQAGKATSISPPPIFDCNAGITKLSDSGSEHNESSAEEHANGKTFDFANLLDNVNSLERAKETIAKHTKEQDTKTTVQKSNTTAMDVYSLLALGEKQSHAAKRSVQRKDDGEEEDDECEADRAPIKLNKTKSTRVKRHTKTRPTSTVVAGDSDDSDFEEVAEDTTSVSHSTTHDSSALLNTTEGLEIHVEMPSKQRRNKDKNKPDLELALRRKLNRDLKERYLSLHKTSLLCCFARSYRYNRMLNDTPLMQASLKLLPSSKAYPPEGGTEIKYFQSMITWYKTAVKLASPNLYGEKVRKSRRRVKRELLAQIKRKEANCKEDFVFIFVVLLRAMGLQCRLIVNMQPLPLRPAKADLLTIKLKRDGDKKEEEDAVESKKLKVGSGVASAKEDKLHGASATKAVTPSGLKSKANSSMEQKEKVSGKADEKVKVMKVKESKEKEKKDKEILNTSIKKQTDKIESSERPKVKKDQAPQRSTHRESKKAPSAKLAEIIADSEIVNQKTNQRGIRRTQAKVANKNLAEVPEGKHEHTKTRSFSKEDLLNSVQPTQTKPKLSRLRSQKVATDLDLAADKPSLSVAATPIARRTRKASTEKAITNKAIEAAKSDKPALQIGSPVIPKIVIQSGKAVSIVEQNERENQPHASGSSNARDTRSRSKSPKMHISPTFLQSADYRNKFPSEPTVGKQLRTKGANSKSPVPKIQISPKFLQQHNTNAAASTVERVLRSRQKPNEVGESGELKLPTVPQLDGADDSLEKVGKKRRPKLLKLKQQSRSQDDSDEDFEPSPPKHPKMAPKLQAKKAVVDRRVLSSDEEESADFEPSPPKHRKRAPKLQTKKAVVDRRVLSSDEEESNGGAVKRNPTAADIWVEVWSDAEEQWVCIDLCKGKLHSVEAIRKAASSSFAYVIAFQNDLSIKDVTARYCPNWTTTVRKSRVERAWLEATFMPYYGQRTQRDICEDQELRRIHEEKPMPTSIGEYKDHPLYALERHLLKFQAIYPPNPPTLGFIRGEAVYARECVHTLHSREIWLKQARTVKLGEQPYKIVKARPKWDRLTQTVIKDQPLEIFGYWQTEDYEPPTAENGIVPRNAYGNVELFKECMLPKKTVHLRLSGLNRICKKLGIDCAQAVVGFDFHQGSCHPLYDGFIVCEEFGDQVTAAWYQDQEEQEKKDQEKYEARVYGNWKKLIKGLIIRERLKKKYNF